MLGKMEVDKDLLWAQICTSAQVKTTLETSGEDVKTTLETSG